MENYAEHSGGLFDRELAAGQIPTENEVRLVALVVEPKADPSRGKVGGAVKAYSSASIETTPASAAASSMGATGSDSGGED